MKFDKNRYKVYTWKNGMMLHWVLNPGVVINDLILGQKVSKIILEDKTIDKPRIERTFIPCPHCETIHDARTWSLQNGTILKNWFGLYCKSCGKTIPCMNNGLSLIILAVTFPIWGWFKNSLKAKWLAKQPERYKNIELELSKNPFGKKTWIKTGLGYGAIMFLIMSIGFPYFEDHEITLKSLTVGIVVWTIFGLIFGYTMKSYMSKRGDKVDKNVTE